MRRAIATIIIVGVAMALTTRVQAAETYTLYNVLSSTTVRLIDLNGNLVKSWTCTRTPSASTPWLILPDSTVLRAQTIPNPPMPGGGAGGHIQLINWNGNVLWNYYYYATNYQQHHDVHAMPNGNVLLIAWERKTNAEARAMGRVNITGEMWPDKIVEVNPANDSIAWEWHAWDHLIQDVDPSKPNYGVVREHPELLDINFGTLPPTDGDWMHTNTMDYNAELDQISFSTHHLSEIYIIDHSTTTEEARTHRGGNSNMGGDLLYRWGNPQAYKRGTSTVQRLFVVHGVNWIRPGLPGAGNLLMFNNGDRPGTTGDSSSVEEIVTPRTGYTYYIHPDSAFGPKQPTWMYSAGTSFYSNHLSGAFRLSSGNTFVCEGTSGHLFEVTPSGTVVWNFNCGGQVQNSKRYDLAPTSVEEDIRCSIHDTRLRIVPNPCRDRVTITLNSADQAISRSVGGRSAHQQPGLKIYDVAGRLVKTFALGSLPQAHCSIALRTGVYFVRLSMSDAAGSATASIKLVVTE